MNPIVTRRQVLRTAGTASLAGAAGLASTASMGVLAGCSSSQSARSTGSADAALTTVSFVLDYLPNVNHTGIYVAMEKGWFAEEGIAVEIVPVPDDGADALIGSGGADMGISYQDRMANSLGSANPLPYTAVAAVVQHNTSGIMSREADGIVRPAAMEGHRYATWGLDVEQATVRQVIEDDSGDFSLIELVNYDTDDEVAGLRADLFDTVWVYEWWAVQNARIQDYPVNYFAFADINEVFDFYTPIICTNDVFAEEHPELVRGFLRAARRGYEYAAAYVEEAAELLCSAVPELDQDLVLAAQEAISPEYISDAEAWGTIDATRWARYYEWLNTNNLVDNQIDTSAGYSLDYLDA